VTPVVTPVPTIKDLKSFSASDIEVIVQNKGITVKASPDGSYKVLGDTQVLIAIPDRVLAGPVKDATLKIGDQQYAMYKGLSYDAVVKLPKLVSNVRVNYVDGNFDDTSFMLDVVGPGEVYETVNAAPTLLPDTKVTLYGYAGGKHPVESITTSGDGAFAFVVTPGTYSVKVEKSGYGTKETAATYEASVVNPQMEIVKIATVKEILATDATPVQKATAIVEQANIQLQIIRDNPVVQQGGDSGRDHGCRCECCDGCDGERRCECGRRSAIFLLAALPLLHPT
jgi:hypothetical protein